jgi:hypothetical protein
MFGVLIVVLSPDGITDLGFSTRKCQILLGGSPYLVVPEKTSPTSPGYALQPNR